MYLSGLDADIISPLIGFRFYVVHSYIEEEDVQVSIWPVCMDTHDPNNCVYTILFYCSQHLWRNFLVISFFNLEQHSCTFPIFVVSPDTRENCCRFLLPATLIVINDIAAYICGFFFGRTPLIKISPKKTWEGFIGASITTMFSAFWVSLLYNLMVIDTILFSYSKVKPWCLSY